jgi:ABC-type phosphate transport system substrate-binding protein
MKLSAWSALTAVVLAVVVTTGVVTAGAGPAAAARPDRSPYAPIEGSGSAFAALAIDEWSSTLANIGLTVNYAPIGSASGQEQYIAGLLDFAGSDLAFRTTRDKLAQLPPEHVPWGYSYIPDVAGGIAFPYHLRVAGHQIRDLRLSGQTLMEIFTGRVTNWDAPQITKDYGHQLPNIPIIPVVDTDGSGATYFFTRWLATEFPAQWNAFCREVTSGRVKPPCGPTEYYPTSGPRWNPKGENGPTAVIDYIKSSFANGAIGYDGYFGALNAGLAVLRLRNPAGRYVLPTPANVTTALKAAVINENPKSPNFLQENLNNVYTFRAPGSYPLSFYSYLIVPRVGTKIPPRFTKAKGRSLSTFIDYGLCAGQRGLTKLGYGELPRNLVAGGLRQSATIPGHIRPPTLARCLRR